MGQFFNESGQSIKKTSRVRARWVLSGSVSFITEIAKYKYTCVIFAVGFAYKRTSLKFSMHAMRAEVYKIKIMLLALIATNNR